MPSFGTNYAQMAWICSAVVISWWSPSFSRTNLNFYRQVFRSSSYSVVFTTRTWSSFSSIWGGFISSAFNFSSLKLISDCLESSVYGFFKIDRVLCTFIFYFGSKLFWNWSDFFDSCLFDLLDPTLFLLSCIIKESSLAVERFVHNDDVSRIFILSLLLLELFRIYANFWSLEPLVRLALGLFGCY